MIVFICVLLFLVGVAFGLEWARIIYGGEIRKRDTEITVLKVAKAAQGEELGNLRTRAIDERRKAAVVESMVIGVAAGWRRHAERAAGRIDVLTDRLLMTANVPSLDAPVGDPPSVGESDMMVLERDRKEERPTKGREPIAISDDDAAPAVRLDADDAAEDEEDDTSFRSRMG